MINSIFNLSKYGLNIKWRLTNCCNFSCDYCVRKNKTENLKNLNKDIEIIEQTIPQISRIILEKRLPTRIELIGGEVSLFDLPSIIKKIYYSTEGYVKKINITTNLSRSEKYYNDIIDTCKKFKINLGLTASWHKKNLSIEKYFNKINNINIHEDGINFLCEMVSLRDNLKDVEDFIINCDKRGINYIIDADVKESQRSNLITSSSKDKENVFKIIKETNECEYSKSLRELNSKYGNLNGNFINLQGYFCSIDSDFVYIDKNMHVGPLENSEDCKIYQPIEDFHFREKYKFCYKGCSLCGFMSVSRNYDDLKNYVEGKKYE